jgi:hypothetical protein
MQMACLLAMNTVARRVLLHLLGSNGNLHLPHTGNGQEVGSKLWQEDWDLVKSTATIMIDTLDGDNSGIRLKKYEKICGSNNRTFHLPCLT